MIKCIVQQYSYHALSVQCQAVELCMPTCWYKLVVFTVRVVQELGEPPEELPHVILLKHLMHCTLHTQGMLGDRNDGQG